MKGDVLEELSAVIGADAALRLCRAFGGVSHYIPQNPATPNAMARLLDDQAAWAKVCAYYGGAAITLPRGDNLLKRRRVDELLRAGAASHRVIAMQTGATERYVRARAKAMRRERARALPLFDKAGR
ncbi:hypothetical protein [Desulfarculus baarsii]